MPGLFRIRILKAFFLIWGIVLFGRLIYVQIIKHPYFRQIAENQYFSSTITTTSRGHILASDGNPLAIDTPTYLAYLEPKNLKITALQSDRLLSILPASDSAAKILRQAVGSDLSWMALSRNIDSQQKYQIEQLSISGLNFEKQFGRFYPEGSPSAYLTGFVGSNDQGLAQGYFGLEGYYNRILTGKPGKVFEQTDALNKIIVIGDRNLVPDRPGENIQTSINRTIQYISAQKLQAGLEKYQASAGTVTVMDAQTGYILAMVSLPNYDQSKYYQYPPALYKNPIVSEGYEPGSTFKTIVMASALDAGVIKPDTKCTACSSAQIISGETVRNYNNQYHPDSTMGDIILHSDNIGMVFVGRKLGKDRLLSYFRKFGFGSKTGVDLQEEDSPALRPETEWYDIDLATASFGQGIAVTRLQMVAAVNSIATGGIYISPRIGVAIDDRTKIRSLPPPPSHRIISPQAASQITQMMVNGVENGEVRYYRLNDYTIAGKTGTAQIPIAGHYDPQKGIASFIAFGPVPNPKFTMLVTLQDPQTSPWGSTTAAPLWFSIAKEILRYYRI